MKITKGTKYKNRTSIQPAIIYPENQTFMYNKQPRKPASVNHEGDQNMSPQHMPLWHEGYFELVAIEKQQMQKRALYSLAICLKLENKIPFVKCHPPPSVLRRGE